MKNSILPALALPLLLAFTAPAQTTNETLAADQTATSFGGGLIIDSRTDQERIDFLLNVATAYSAEGDSENGINAFKRVLEIDPLNRQARSMLGQIYINTKQYAEAEAHLLKLISEYPDDPLAKNNLAWLYATSEDPAFRRGEEAIRLAQEAVAISPADHHIWSTLSEAYYVTGEYEKAYRAIEHMANVAARYGKNMTKELVDGYNEQILKCKRALDSEKALKGATEADEEDTAAPDTTPSDQDSAAGSAQ